MIKKIIRDNIHSDIVVTDEVIWELINTPELQRLRRIRQLGGTELAFPSASHTRFSHSIGVYHVICMFMQNPNFGNISSYEQLIVKIAGLLHDIGHGAFSHTFEKITTRSHEEYSADIINNPNGEIYKILNKYKINAKDIISILKGTYSNKILNLLVSSQLDADRLDYLLRDAYNCNVNYAALENNWIIRHAFIRNNKIVFEQKVLPAIESYLMGRYHMYMQVYNHKMSLSFDYMFSNWFKRAKQIVDSNQCKSNDIIEFVNMINQNLIPVYQYLTIDDYQMFNLYKIGIKEDDAILSMLSNALVNRVVYHVVKYDEIDFKKESEKFKNSTITLEYGLIEVNIPAPCIYKSDFTNSKDEHIYIDINGKDVPFSELSAFGKTMSELSNKKNEKKWLFFKQNV